ncbi:LOW QUALITY PROTEIN: uncharacterized protein Z518_02714 [Rhinocladiella mackenziei CBS 650.93]|uniref:Uncharacterized protein n=1 Tax=Rhinocladiella mackenziei CBS 650.93 TaxID=1442369 RepID=A0A0D2IQ96_9EURO|nr:LOW QUALITY PROTEIN: uncharacterized protein Z518_02714 [Rhinocladiella mackenziei CBS 650.93]KIX08059.1 LOW QUALITY PROTEIN: hypothetical protein Z518_02714 [Rhinocladiella mackenziei CBS 650.93]
MTTNLLLVCPRVADVLKSHQQMSFIRQLRNYVEFQLQQQGNPRLEWIFFLKDREMLFSHTPRSLKKFLHSVPAEINVLSFGYGNVQQALGILAIRVDYRSIGLLDSALELLQQRPGLTEASAITIALATLNNRVAYIPQWWFEVRGNCLEPATWEAQSGVTHVVKADELCCVSDLCQAALSDVAKQSKRTGNQAMDSQAPLTSDSGLSVEHAVEDFWTCMKNMDVCSEVSPAVNLSEALVAEQSAAGECRGV